MNGVLDQKTDPHAAPSTSCNALFARKPSEVAFVFAQQEVVHKNNTDER